MSDNLSPIDKLFDENNEDNIILYNENGEPTEFSQAAIIPLEDKMYAILSPVTPIEGVAEDEGLVFLIEEDIDGEDTISVVTDQEIVDKIFSIYEDLLREEGIVLE